jgi:hypothetical protein
MTISRTAVWGLLLGLLWLWLPSGVGAQGNINCRVAVDNLFKKAENLSIDFKAINAELTSLPTNCKVKESDSILRLPRYREQVKAEQEETAESEWRFDRYGKSVEKVKKNEKNFKSQSSPYDPGGTPGGPGPGTY